MRTLCSRPPILRMTRLHEQLQARCFPNCRKLAAMLEVSAKTIQRDIDYMRDALGLPIAYDEKRFGFFYTNPAPPKPFPWLNELRKLL